MSASGKVAKKIALFEIRPPGTEQTCRLKRKHAIRRKRYIRERRSLPNDIPHSQSQMSLPTAVDGSEKVSSEFSASCSALHYLGNGDTNDESAINNRKNDKENYFKPNTLLRSSSLDNISSRHDRERRYYLQLVDINIEGDDNSENFPEEGAYEIANHCISISDHFKVNQLNYKNSNDMNRNTVSNNHNSDYREYKAENFYENIVPRFLLNSVANGDCDKSSVHAKRKSGLEIIQSLMIALGGPPRITGSSEDIYTTNSQLSEAYRMKCNSDPEAVGRVDDGDDDEPFYEELYDYYMSSCCCNDRNCDSTACVTANNCHNNNKTDINTLRNNKADCEAMAMAPATHSICSYRDKKDAENTTPSSSRPPTPPPYESLYSEPIYGEAGNLTQSLPPLSLYNNSQRSDNFSPSSSSSTYGGSNHIIPNKSRIISTTIRKDSIYSPSAASSSGSNTSGGIYNDSVSGFYGVTDKLPPTPPNKFSSIAKSAGRRLAKRFMQIRRISRTSLSHLESPMSSSSSSGRGSALFRDISTAESVYNASNSSTCSGSGSCGKERGPAPLRRQISRPSIPPPEPPKIEDVTNEKNVSNISETVVPETLYEKSVITNSQKQSQNNEADDDYDDSDFYDSDSDLIRNFVSQVQPIYSMEEEPLYQYYTYGINLKPEDDYQPVIPKNLGLTLDMLVPRVGQRTLWCEIPEVVTSGILAILSDKQKQLQEAIFEILTSEVSYIKSLDVLISLFYKHEELVGVLTEDERCYLFGNITEVKDCAQAFLAELLGKWEESWYIQEIGDIINRNANTRFSVYKDYCRNKPYQDRTMQRLRHSRDEFVNVIKSIEEDPKCQMLRMDSFLMLPMQRITRLPLLVNAVIQRTQSVKEKGHCEEALKNLTNLVLACNDAARESQDAEETAAIVDKIEFPRGMRNNYNLGQFVMKGDFMKNPFDQQGRGQLNWTFRKAKRTFYWLLLFNNQLLITKKKANGRFEVLDVVLPSDSYIKPLPNLEGVSKDFQHFFMLHFNRKETVYFLAARTKSEVERWKTKLETMKTHKELKVEAIFPYDARREDELSFHVGDLIEVSQMQPDGWYYGTRLDNGNAGWFPGNYCCEA